MIPTEGPHELMALVQLGELSAGRVALEAAELAPHRHVQGTHRPSSPDHLAHRNPFPTIS